MSTLPPAPDPADGFQRPPGLDRLLDYISQHLHDDTTPASPALHLLTTILALDADLDADEAHMVVRQVLGVHALELAGDLATTRRNLTPWDVDRVAPGMQRAEILLRHYASNLDLDVPPRRARIVCLCGSTRFMDEMTEEARRLTFGSPEEPPAIVLKPDCDLKTPHPLWTDPAAAEAGKARLDDVHRQKIRMADEVLVVGDTIGNSTRAEIAYARSIRRPVRFTHPEVDPAHTTKQAAS